MRGRERSPYLLSILCFSSQEIGTGAFLEVQWLGLQASQIPQWCSGKESDCQCKRHRFNPWSRKITYATEQLSVCSITVEPVL